MKKWEYYSRSMTRVAACLDDLDLDSYGLDGWELVSVIVLPNGERIAYFKRPME